jgi:ethylbenzene dioxygenase subunit beta
MRADLEAFVLHEARLLDERRFADWLALFAEDGEYWVPTLPGQASPQAALSLFHEPKPLLAMRVARLERPDMHSQAPASRTVHHVSAVEVCGELEVRSALIVAEWRAGEARWFAGRVLHRLRHEAGALRIVLKRVDLIDSEAPQRAITVPF